MSTATLPPWNTFDPPPVPVRRFTVTEYHRLIEIGMFTEDDRVELLEGWIVPKMPHNPAHDATIQLADEQLRSRLARGWTVRIQSAITTADSEPEPDLAVVRGNARSYLRRHPGPRDIGLLIEVADSTLTQDRGDKLRIVARAGIPVYWIINLVDRRIEVYSEPTGPAAEPAYRAQQTCGIRKSVPLVIDGEENARIPVRALLP